MGETGSRRRLHRLALWLVAGTLSYNIVEASVAIIFGRHAESIALVGFGLDSIIESVAASVLLWRLWRGARRGNDSILAHLDRRVHRVVGVTFLVLAAYVLLQSAWVLASRLIPEETMVGIALAIASVLMMPAVSIGKIRVARRLGSPALAAEAKETIACSYLSLALLLGLVLNSLLGWWWADPVAALLMVPWLIKEGIEGLRGECACA